MMKRRNVLNLWVALITPLTAVAQAPPASRTPQIPLREGLTIVTAVNNGKADFESIKRITHMDATNVKLTYSADIPVTDPDDSPIAALLGGDCLAKPGERDQKKVQGSVVRTVRREDLETAHDYRQRFNLCTSLEELYPGSTALGVSSSVLRELTANGQTRLSVTAPGAGAAFVNLIGGLLGGTSKELGDASMVSGVLKRVEHGTIPFKVLVNDELVELPAVHARGRLGDEAAEFWILNDPANPLSLRWSLGDQSENLQVIKLSYPLQATAAGAPTSPGTAAAPATTTNIERDLAKEGRAVVYGIYFDFASDRIKEESDAVLAEIAGVLQKNPGWSLALEGHTDNIGGDPYNLDLSTRRAAAVKQALMSRYKVDGKRLQTAGYGASRPKDSNETLEGRARNRRVELVRL